MMKSTSLLSIALTSLVVAGGFGLFRQRLLVSLQDELSFRQSASTQITTAELPGKLPAIAGEKRGREPASFPPLVRSRAGWEHIAEASECLSIYMARKHFSIPERESYPEVDRLKELLAGMGADAVAEVFKESSRNHFNTEVLENFYLSMNPSQALLLAMDLPPSPFRHAFLGKSFTAWTYMDPEAALHWQREEMKKGNPDASDPEIQLQAAICSSRIDPKQAAALIVRLSEGVPGAVGTSTGFEIAKFLRTPAERADMLLALDASIAGSSNVDAVKEIRDAVVQQMMVNFQGQSVSEAAPVLDQAFTWEERQEFADTRGGMDPGNLSEARGWAAWLAGQEGSLGYVAPVVNFLGMAGERFPELLDETDWIEKLPDHEARQRAIYAYAYANCLLAKRPEVARQWLERLDEGPAKERLRSCF